MVVVVVLLKLLLLFGCVMDVVVEGYLLRLWLSSGGFLDSLGLDDPVLERPRLQALSGHRIQVRGQGHLDGLREARLRGDLRLLPDGRLLDLRLQARQFG